MHHKSSSFVHQLCSKFERSYDEVRPIMKGLKHVTDSRGAKKLLGLSPTQSKVYDQLELQYIAENNIPTQVQSVLEHLKEQGIKIGVYSNCTYLTKKIINSSRVNLDLMCLSFEIGALKPSDKFYGVLSRMVKSVGNPFVICVGNDIIKDIIPVVQLGYKGIHLTSTISNTPEFDWKFDQINSLDQIINYVK